MKRFLRRTRAVAHKEVLHIIRDSRALYLALGLPVVMLILFGYGMSTDMAHVPIAVADQDASSASRRLVQSLTAGGDFRIADHLASPAAARGEFRRGRAKVVLVIPAGFERDLVRRHRADAQLLVDGSDSTSATIAAAEAAAIAQATRFGRNHPQVSSGGGPPVRIRFNPALRSSYGMVSGVIVMILAMVASLLAALTVAREWERGNMEQLFATPVGRAEIIIGKLLPYAGIGMVQTLMVLTLGSWIFDVPIRGSLVVLFGSALLFIVSVLGVGLLASVTTKNQLLAVQFALVASYMPVALLSGFLFPIENMPWWLRGLSMAVPGRYFLVVIRGTLLKGEGFGALSHQVLALALFAVVVVVLAVRRFVRRLS